MKEIFVKQQREWKLAFTSPIAAVNTALYYQIKKLMHCKSSGLCFCKCKKKIPSNALKSGVPYFKVSIFLKLQSNSFKTLQISFNRCCCVGLRMSRLEFDFLSVIVHCTLDMELEFLSTNKKFRIKVIVKCDCSLKFCLL